MEEKSPTTSEKNNERGAKQQRGWDPLTVHTHICPYVQSRGNPNLPGEAEPWTFSLMLGHQLLRQYFLKRGLKTTSNQINRKSVKMQMPMPCQDPENIPEYLRRVPGLHISRKLFGSFSSPFEFKNHYPKGSWTNPILATCCPELGMGSEGLFHLRAPAMSAPPSPGTHQHCTGEKMK